MIPTQAPVIQFDEAAHIYTVDGIVRPSVTQILSGVGLIDGQWFTDESRERGRAVHAATHYMDEGDLDPDSVSPVILPYLAGWEAFKNDTGAEILSLEQAVYHTELGFAGRLDRKLLMYGKSQKWIADLKTGAAQDWHRLQLAAYAACQPENLVQYQRCTVHLTKEGKYSLRTHPMRDTLRDWADFQAALRVFQLQKRRSA